MTQEGWAYIGFDRSAFGFLANRIQSLTRRSAAMATRFCWVFVGLIVATSMVAAIAGDWNFLGGPACCGPSFGMVTLKPGCCETPPSCCRGVWEGYCESKRAGGWCRGYPCRPVIIGRRAGCRGSQMVCPECETPLVPAEDPLMSSSSTKANDVSSLMTEIRVKPAQEPGVKFEASSAPVIPLPPVSPDTTE